MYRCGVESNMYDELKEELEMALFEHEKFLQMLNLSEEQQQQLTKSLECFSEFNDKLRNIFDIHDRIMAGIEARFEKLGRTDEHTGPKTLEYRLDMIEGCLSILHGAHKGHTNYSEVEYYGMHDNIETNKGQLDALQKKLDRITKLLENAEFTISGKEALKL